jgi:serine/threonine protein kinase
VHIPSDATAALTLCHVWTRQEVSILRSLNYDRNVVQFYGACLQEGSDPMLVTEYMEGATLYLKPAQLSSASYTFQQCQHGHSPPKRRI